MKIVFLDAATVGDLPNIQKLRKLGDYIPYDYTTLEQRQKRIEDAEVIITNKVLIDEEIIASAPNLKLICVAATGTNNVDINCAEKHNIEVKNVAGYSTDSVVQMTFSILFELLSHTSHYNNYIQSGEYSKSQSFTLITPSFNELKGKRIGVVGLGAIGEKVATIAKVFGAEVVYYSTSGVNYNEEFNRIELDELLTTCDIISIHSPLNEKTNNLFDYERLSKMKPTSFIINVGRGGIINETDLVRILNEDKICGAGIDVFTKEPMEISSPYLKVKNKQKLVATPHVAWASIESRMLLIDKIVENIKSSF